MWGDDNAYSTSAACSAPKPGRRAFNSASRVVKRTITCRVSRRPASDSSRMEGFFGTMKNEMFCGRDWEGVSLEELGKRIDDYIEWYNTKRIRRSLGSMSPLAYRQSLALAD